MGWLGKKFNIHHPTSITQHPTPNVQVKNQKMKKTKKRSKPRPSICPPSIAKSIQLGEFLFSSLSSFRLFFFCHLSIEK